MEETVKHSVARTQSSLDVGLTSDQKYLAYIIGAFALAGLYSVGFGVFNFVRLLLSLFVLPGKPVRYTSSPPNHIIN